MNLLTCFNTCDIKGEVGEELTPEIVAKTGKAMALFLRAKLIVIGGDCRMSTPELKQAAIDGVRSVNCDVVDIGLCGAEELYFATTFLNACGGIVITSSHYSKNHNGMKLVKVGGQPITINCGLFEIKNMVKNIRCDRNSIGGSLKALSTLTPYIEHLLSFVELKYLKPQKLVVMAGSDVAGNIIDIIQRRFWQEQIPVEFYKIYHQVDHNFPNEIQNTILSKNKDVIKQSIMLHRADLGIVWDCGFDKCFFFDDKGEYIKGNHIVELLADSFYNKYIDERVIYEPKFAWDFGDIINSKTIRGIEPKLAQETTEKCKSKIDHQRGMNSHNNEQFSYRYSGMLPWLLMIELISNKNQPLSSLIKQKLQDLSPSNEIN